MTSQPNRAEVVGGKSSLLRQLRENTAGNVLAISAAAMIPMMGVIGGGVDISRAYLVKSRLQQACDAGVLGGRKVMTSTGVDSAVTAEVQKFVNFNFPQGTSGTTPFTVTPTDGTNSSIDMTLSTTMPTAIMKVLGVNSVAVSATCTARQDYVNTDVVLVLDTTGSMNCLPSDSATASCPTEKSGSKIQALRSAVTSFYNALKPAQTELESKGLRLRYGIIPYSSNVNAGRDVIALNSSYMNTVSNYRNASGVAYSVDHGLISGGNAFWTNTANWAGCTEEAQTVNNIDSTSGYTPPSGAYDLAVDSIPSSTSTRWNAFDPNSEGGKQTSSTAWYACPTRIKTVAALSDVSAINSYTAGLVANGGTYHDIGMMWAARLLSPTGIWGSNNPSTYNGFPVNRHVIFMTDGALDTDPSIYGAHGIEKFDKRVTPTGSNATLLDTSHIQRFRMMCNSVKGSNTSVWVIAFGTSSGTGLSQELINCATNTSQAFKADDQATLISQFTQIGATIGALRLSQ